MTLCPWIAITNGNSISRSNDHGTYTILGGLPTTGLGKTLRAGGEPHAQRDNCRKFMAHTAYHGSKVLACGIGTNQR